MLVFLVGLAFYFLCVGFLGCSVNGLGFFWLLTHAKEKPKLSGFM